MSRKLRYDEVQLAPSKISEYEHEIYGPITVFHDVVIAREIVHEYDDGMAYKPAKELENAYWTVDGRWARAGGHPTTSIIFTKEDINGRTVEPKFTKSLKDIKTKRPNNRGILANLEVFNNKVTPETLDDMKNGKKSEVSIGFSFEHDETSGTIDEDGHPLNGTSYDYVQRNIMIDHIAFALEEGSGRCPMPACGIGADEIEAKATGDPFAGYEDFEDCIQKQMAGKQEYTREQAEGVCGLIYKRHKEKHKKDAEKNKGMEDIKEKLNDILSKLDNLVEEERQGNASSETEAERAKMFFNISDEDWLALTDEQKNEYLNKLPPEIPKEGESSKDSWFITKDEFKELPHEKQVALLYIMDCGDCVEEWEIEDNVLKAVEKIRIGFKPDEPKEKVVATMDEIKRTEKLLSEL